MPTSPLKTEDAAILLRVESKRDRLFFACMLFSGRRIGEVKEMKWSFLFDERGPKIWVSKQKKFMYFPKSSKLLKIIEECYGDQDMDSYIFTGRRGCDGKSPMGHSGINKMIKRYFATFNIITRQNASHCLRKTFAKNIIEKNVKLGMEPIKAYKWLQKYFGHRSLDYTFMYTGFEEEELNGMVENVCYD